MGNTITKNTKNCCNIQQGRWILKNKNGIAITTYWSNIDHCGDSLCGNTMKAKEFLVNQIKHDHKPVPVRIEIDKK